MSLIRSTRTSGLSWMEFPFVIIQSVTIIIPTDK